MPFEFCFFNSSNNRNIIKIIKIISNHLEVGTIFFLFEYITWTNTKK